MDLAALIFRIAGLRRATSNSVMLGIIAPFDLAMERELWRWVPTEVTLPSGPDPDEPVPVSMGMAELVSNRPSRAATRDVLHVEPGVVAYLCTSGSFVNGVDSRAEPAQAICGARSQGTRHHLRALAEVLRCTHTSTGSPSSRPTTRT